MIPCLKYIHIHTYTYTYVPFAGPVWQCVPLIPALKEACRGLLAILLEPQRDPASTNTPRALQSHMQHTWEKKVQGYDTVATKISGPPISLAHHPKPHFSFTGFSCWRFSYHSTLLHDRKEQKNTSKLNRLTFKQIPQESYVAFSFLSHWAGLSHMQS